MLLAIVGVLENAFWFERDSFGVALEIFLAVVGILAGAAGCLSLRLARVDSVT